MLKLRNSKITGGFWGDWQAVNSNKAIFHQWEQLEKTGCIDNFRILAKDKQVFRRGWFFADSDAYKWLDAAFRILYDKRDQRLSSYVDGFVDLIEEAQSPDGYLYTFNQVHFPGTRWVNLQIEHELYCHGHLIEAFVSGCTLEDYEGKIAIATKAADCIISYFRGRGPKYTPGHEEIEIALLRLYEVTGQQDYLEMARQFLEMRGKQVFFAVDILRQSVNNSRRVNEVEAERIVYFESHDHQEEIKLPPSNTAKKPGDIQVRWIQNALSGKLLQQHKPVIKQTVPVGHAVRFAYLETAAAMVDRLTGQETYRSTLEKSWDHMVGKRMYLTGGVGSLPVIEGFGRDYELDPEFAYAETCAALGSIFWDREMAQLTGEASYSDLFEWQLYNAALVGIGVEGKTYFYNNPLTSRGGIERRSWYEVPCCPSNLSRTIAWLQKDVLNIRGESIDIKHYITSHHVIEFDESEMILEMISGFPWDGKVQINLINPPSQALKFRLRRPAWAKEVYLAVNGERVTQHKISEAELLNPNKAVWVEVNRKWETMDQLSLEFSTPVEIYKPADEPKAIKDKAALTRGPLVYCLESVDNPGVDIFNVILDPESIEAEYSEDMLGGIWLIKGYSEKEELLTFIPYYLWGNRGASTMTVFFGMKEEA